MGWCSGSIMANDVWNIVREHVPEDKRSELARKIIEVFRGGDADCWDPGMAIVDDCDYLHAEVEVWYEVWSKAARSLIAAFDTEKEAVAFAAVDALGFAVLRCSDPPSDDDGCIAEGEALLRLVETSITARRANKERW